MKNIIILLLGLLITFSCADNLIEKPANLIPEGQMVLILKEMAIVNGVKAIDNTMLKENGVDPTTYVFNKFNIDSTQFVDSDRYYASKPLVYESLYERTEAAVDSIMKEMERKKKIKDSLKRIKAAKKRINY